MEIKSYKKKDGTTAYSFEIYVGKRMEEASLLESVGLKLNQMPEKRYLSYKAS